MTKESYEGWHQIIYNAFLKKSKYFKHPLADMFKQTMQDHHLLADTEI